VGSIVAVVESLPNFKAGIRLEASKIQDRTAMDVPRRQSVKL
jgi:hypothetical protein